MMLANNNNKERESLYQFGLAKLCVASQENISMLVNHLFRLKVNDDYVINSDWEVEELVDYINDNG